MTNSWRSQQSPPDAGARTRRTVDESDVAQFSRLSAQWWNSHGPWATLHKFNAVRVAYIRDRAAEHFSREPGRPRVLQSLHILDIGCGGGILSEPLARLGATTVGIDPSESNIAVARAHAAEGGLSIKYSCMAVEEVAEAGDCFDVVLAMEVIEHVADVGLFLDRAAAMVKPGGLLFVGTLNRTIRSFAFAIVAAEYMLGWIPRGTHQWRKFVKPSELGRALERNGMRIKDKAGVIYNPFVDRFQLARDMSASYMILAEKATAAPE